MATLCSIVRGAGDDKQGKNIGQKLLSGAREGIDEAYRCSRKCFERHSEVSEVGRCIGVNLIRNIKAMMKKHQRNNPDKYKDSRELDRSLNHVYRVIQEISQKTHHQND